jgi:hypothetical protein
MKYLDIFLDFVGRNKTPITVVLCFILLFLAYDTGCNGKYKKEVKALEKEIAIVQDQFEEAVNEKERYKDSSELYEQVAEQSDILVEALKVKAEQQRKAKEAALAALQNLPKEVIDTFFVKRYDTVTKIGVDLALDQNVGNAIVVELTEKDHLVGELATVKEENNALTSQTDALQKSLMFSKAALTNADSAIAYRTKQFELSQQVSELLKKDLKTANKKAFWNKWKGVGVGIAAGITVGLLAK